MLKAPEKSYYDDYWTSEGYGYGRANIYPELRSLLEAHVTASSTCLDVGCGDGRACGLWLHEHAASYTGVDISSTAVDQARSLGLEAQTIDDAGNLPFPNDHFDVVICTEVLEHLFAPHLTATDIFRVLRPGGVLIVTVPNTAYWRRRTDAVIGRWNPMGDAQGVEQPWRDPHVRFFTVKTLRGMLTSIGFDVAGMGGHGGAFFGDIPLARRLFTKKRSGYIYDMLQNVLPSLFSIRLYAVVRKPVTT